MDCNGIFSNPFLVTFLRLAAIFLTVNNFLSNVTNRQKKQTNTVKTAAPWHLYLLKERAVLLLSSFFVAYDTDTSQTH